jgi:UDP-GlcNAc:undecaprenyl-phosphate/decaprenyl-phosphate GlcNAc-1-phosphate transferase
MSLPLWLLAISLAGWATTFALTGAARRLGELLGAIDSPRPGEVQVRSIPRSGGYAMLAGLWAAVGVIVLLRPAWVTANASDDFKLMGALLGTLLILPLAILDDRRRLGAWPQFIGQVGVAAVPVAFGLRMESLATPLGQPFALPAWLDVPFTLFWIVGMINAVNLIDVMDGLAAGIAALAAIVLFTRSLWFGQYTVAVLPLALAGCALGYLPHNFHPARIFMGTSGSVLLGYWLATMSVIGGAKVGTAFVVLGVPILDTAWVIGRRLLARRSPFIGGDAEHLPHRIHALGLSQVQTVLVLYLICAAFGALSLTLHSPAEGPTMAKVYLLLGMVAVMALVLSTVTILSVRRKRRVKAGG